MTPPLPFKVKSKHYTLLQTHQIPLDCLGTSINHVTGGKKPKGWSKDYLVITSILDGPSLSFL